MAGRTLTPADVSGDALLERGLTDVTSATFSVTVSPMRVVAFGLTDDEVKVMRVLKPTANASRNDCGELQSQADIYEQPHRIGCEQVVICTAQPDIVIDAVGHYKVVYSGDHREDVHVTVFPDNVVRTENNMRGIEACCQTTAPVEEEE